MKNIVIILVIFFSTSCFSQIFTQQELATKLGYSSNIYENQILSSDERDSLSSYTSYDDPLYEDVNGYLRGTTSNFWYFQNTAEIDVQIKLMDRAIRRLPRLPQEMVLFRGQTLGYRKDKKFEVGEIVTDKAYWSATTSLKVAERFSNSDGSVFVIYNNQKDFKGVNLNSLEEEVLLPRDIVARVMKSKLRNNLQLALVQLCETEQSCEKEITRDDIKKIWAELK